MDQLYKQVVAFQHRCNDWIDDHSDSAAQSLKREVQRLEDDVQVSKSPASIEGTVRQVISQLQRAGQSGVMSPEHVDELIDQCEDFRRQLQKLG